MDSNDLGRGPPLQRAPVNGFYYPSVPAQMGMLAPQPVIHGWQPQPVFGPAVQQWVPVAAVQSHARGMGQQYRQAATGDRSPLERARQVLADALKRGKELGMSQREVLECLQNSDKPEYRGINWTAYFLENAVLPNGGTSGHSDTAPNEGHDAPASQASRSTASTDEPAQKKRKTTNETPSKTIGKRPRGRPPKRKVQPVAPPRNTHGRFSRSHDARSLASSISTASSSTVGRVKRGGRLLEFHTETYIPPSNARHKPAVPRRDPEDDLSRFTDEELIFFIHYMRWRLRKGRVPSKDVLFKELAKELPHHDAQAWRKHWADHCQLPDKIYIAALKREQDEEFPSSESDSSTLTPAPTTDNEYRPSSPGGRSSPVLSATSSAVPISTHQKVTEDDLRAMAMYMVEKQHIWSQYHNRAQCWKEFARRKENLRRRSYGGWYNAARHHASQIREYYEQYMAEKEEKEEEDEDDERETRRLVSPVDQDEELTTPYTVSSAKVSNLHQKNGAAANPSLATVEDQREYIEISDSD